MVGAAVLAVWSQRYEAAEGEVGQYGEQRYGYGTLQYQRQVPDCQACDDGDSEAASADDGRNGRRADRVDRADPHASQDGAQRQRRLELPEERARAHAHSTSGFLQFVRYALQAGDSVARDGQQSV